MGPERIDAGLTAFKDGESSWSACFFARAYPELQLHRGDAEAKVAKALGMEDNKVPMRIVYHTFDGLGITMSKSELRGFIESFVKDKQNPEVAAEIEKLLSTLNYEGVEEKELDFALCGAGKE